MSVSPADAKLLERFVLGNGIEEPVLVLRVLRLLGVEHNIPENTNRVPKGSVVAGFSIEPYWRSVLRLTPDALDLGDEQRKERRAVVSGWKERAKSLIGGSIDPEIRQAMLRASRGQDIGGAKMKREVYRLLGLPDYPTLDEDVVSIRKVLAERMPHLVELYDQSRPAVSQAFREMRRDADEQHAKDLRSKALAFLGIDSDEDVDWQQEHGFAMPPLPQGGTFYTCSACFRSHAVSADGLVVNHGYRRPGTGSLVGRCAGVGAVPWEHGVGALPGVLSGLEEALDTTRAWLANGYEEHEVAEAKGWSGTIYPGDPRWDAVDARVRRNDQRIVDWLEGERFMSLAWIRAALRTWTRSETHPVGAPTPRILPEDHVRRPTSRNVVIRHHGDRRTASLEDLAAHYKAQGLSVHKAWDELIRDRGLRPDTDLKVFIGIYDRVRPRTLDSTETVSFTPTHRDPATGKLIQVTRAANGGWDLIFEHGGTGSNPASMDPDSFYEKLAPEAPEAPEATEALGPIGRAERIRRNAPTVEEADRWISILDIAKDLDLWRSTVEFEAFADSVVSGVGNYPARTAPAWAQSATGAILPSFVEAIQKKYGRKLDPETVGRISLGIDELYRYRAARLRKEILEGAASRSKKAASGLAASFADWVQGLRTGWPNQDVLNHVIESIVADALGVGWVDIEGSDWARKLIERLGKDEAPSGETPDPEPAGEDWAYYVTARNDEGRTVAIGGPFETHAEALAQVQPLTDRAYAADPFAAMEAAFGTARLYRNDWPPERVRFNPRWKSPGGERDGEIIPEEAPEAPEAAEAAVPQVPEAWLDVNPPKDYPYEWRAKWRGVPVPAHYKPSKLPEPLDRAINDAIDMLYAQLGPFPIGKWIPFVVKMDGNAQKMELLSPNHGNKRIRRPMFYKYGTTSNPGWFIWRQRRDGSWESEPWIDRAPTDPFWGKVPESTGSEAEAAGPEARQDPEVAAPQAPALPGGPAQAPALPGGFDSFGVTTPDPMTPEEAEAREDDTEAEQIARRMTHGTQRRYGDRSYRFLGNVRRDAFDNRMVWNNPAVFTPRLRHGGEMREFAAVLFTGGDDVEIWLAQASGEVDEAAKIKLWSGTVDKVGNVVKADPAAPPTGLTPWARAASWVIMSARGLDRPPEFAPAKGGEIMAVDPLEERLRYVIGSVPGGVTFDVRFDPDAGHGGDEGIALRSSMTSHAESTEFFARMVKDGLRKLVPIGQIERGADVERGNGAEGKEAWETAIFNLNRDPDYYDRIAQEIFDPSLWGSFEDYRVLPRVTVSVYRSGGIGVQTDSGENYYATVEAPRGVDYRQTEGGNEETREAWKAWRMTFRILQALLNLRENDYNEHPAGAAVKEAAVYAVMGARPAAAVLDAAGTRRPVTTGFSQAFGGEVMENPRGGLRPAQDPSVEFVVYRHPGLAALRTPVVSLAEAASSDPAPTRALALAQWPGFRGAKFYDETPDVDVARKVLSTAQQADQALEADRRANGDPRWRFDGRPLPGVGPAPGGDPIRDDLDRAIRESFKGVKHTSVVANVHGERWGVPLDMRGDIPADRLIAERAPAGSWPMAPSPTDPPRGTVSGFLRSFDAPVGASIPTTTPNGEDWLRVIFSMVADRVTESPAVSIWPRRPELRDAIGVMTDGTGLLFATDGYRAWGIVLDRGPEHPVYLPMEALAAGGPVWPVGADNGVSPYAAWRETKDRAPDYVPVVQSRGQKTGEVSEKTLKAWAALPGPKKGDPVYDIDGKKTGSTITRGSSKTPPKHGAVYDPKTGTFHVPWLAETSGDESKVYTELPGVTWEAGADIERFGVTPRYLKEAAQSLLLGGKGRVTVFYGHPLAPLTFVKKSDGGFVQQFHMLMPMRLD